MTYAEQMQPLHFYDRDNAETSDTNRGRVNPPLQKETENVLRRDLRNRPPSSVGRAQGP